MDTIYTARRDGYHLEAIADLDHLVVVVGSADGGAAIRLTQAEARSLSAVITQVYAPGAPHDDPLRYEPETCGTHHLIAERILRIVESAARSANPLPERGDLDRLVELASSAGVHFARRSLSEPSLDQEVPI